MSTQANITHTQLMTLYEVSKKVNSQLNYRKVLDEIMDSAIELLQAEKGVLLLKHSGSGDLTVEVARFLDKRSIDEVVALSNTVIQKVEDEKKSILIQNIPETYGTQATLSQKRYKLKSVICVPLYCKNKLIGAIYLDTANPDHFFKNEDIAFLEGFANLAGIAIENAQTYNELEKLNNNLEARVKDATHEIQTQHLELKSAYENLKSTQTQLLRSEKMASLGMLVAGIAHEINTPIGAINSNMDTFTRSFEKLHGLANAKGQNPKLSKTLGILDKIAKVNLDACNRVSRIVKTLKNFARLDEQDFKKVNLHEGIDSTLALTAHLNKGRIEVVKNYGDIPPLECYASQLNQVFMNVLVNCSQAIEGKGTITILTESDDKEICLSFSDTGKGIPADIIEKIFDPGFTTKGVGVGTGLGLSITHKIVDEHGGRIEVQSAVGNGTTFKVHLPLQKPIPNDQTD